MQSQKNNCDVDSIFIEVERRMENKMNNLYSFMDNNHANLENKIQNLENKVDKINQQNLISDKKLEEIDYLYLLVNS